MHFIYEVSDLSTGAFSQFIRQTLQLISFRLEIKSSMSDLHSRMNDH